jgi:hypothetical protein
MGFACDYHGGTRGNFSDNPTGGRFLGLSGGQFCRLPRATHATRIARGSSARRQDILRPLSKKCTLEYVEGSRESHPENHMSPYTKLNYHFTPSPKRLRMKAIAKIA